jgi:hypothetical protein
MKGAEMKKTDGPRTPAEIPAMGWTRFTVRWHGLTKLCGSVPADPEIVKAWLLARTPRVQPPGGLTLDQINEEVLASLSEDRDALGHPKDESAILTFQRHAGQCVMRGATLKAHLKDCARRLSARVGKIEGESAFSTKVINYLYPDPAQYWVQVLRPDGTPVSKHDGEMDRPVTTRFGTALKRFEWIEPWRLDFTIQVFTTSGRPAVGLEDLRKLLLYGGVHGYAGERGNGEGKYSADIEEEKRDEEKRDG